MSITVPAERVKRTRGAVSDQMARNARMPGFRKGKLPSRVVEQRFGPSIDQETVDRTIQEAYREALESQGLTPINQGKVDRIEYKPGADLTFEVELEVRPEIELTRLSGFTLTRAPLETSEDDVTGVLERLRDERATWEALEGEGLKPAAGQQVSVEITPLSTDGEPQEDATPRPYRFVIGEGQAIPDVEEAILSLGLGEEGDFTARFPDDFPDEASRGVEQRLHIRLTGIERKIAPELDDEFAKGVGEFETLEALRERIRADLETEAGQRADGELRQQLVDRILEANPFSVPNSMVDRYLDYMTGHSHEEGKPHHHTAEEEERIGAIRATLRPQAEWGLKRTLVVEHIAEQEGLNATQDEIDSKVEELASAHGRTPSEVWLQLEKSGQLEVLERELTQDKVFTFLLGQNTVA
ncbi:MAG: trigger factor [Gemmatimonadetes bacterium]|nr:trigger factor [Gemmatimonadota bacterium]